MRIGLDFYMNRVRVEEQVTTRGGLASSRTSVRVPTGVSRPPHLTYCLCILMSFSISLN